jgi:hypothetical protein
MLSVSCNILAELQARQQRVLDGAAESVVLLESNTTLSECMDGGTHQQFTLAQTQQRIIVSQCGDSTSPRDSMY